MLDAEPPEINRLYKDIPGAASADEVQENFDMARYDIPTDLWAELKREGLLPENAPTP